MNYKKLQTFLHTSAVESDIKNQTYCYGHTISETIDGVILINRKPTLFETVDQARNYIKESRVQDIIQKEIQQEMYEDLSDNKVVNIIRSHYEDVKITDTLIESYIQLASSKVFNTDPVSFDIRKTNRLDNIVEDRLDFKLNDGTPIVISEELYYRINNIFGQHEDVIKYMRESAENFLSVVDQIED